MSSKLLAGLLKGSHRKKTVPVKATFPIAITGLEEGEIPGTDARIALFSILEKEANSLTINAGYPRSATRGAFFQLPGDTGTVKIVNTRPAGTKTLPYRGDMTEPNFPNRIHYLQSLPVYSESDFLKAAPTGAYTWILYFFKDDLKKTIHFAAMKVLSMMEYGSGHASIVRAIQEKTGLPVRVILAGELQKANKENILFNLLSGTFAWNMIQGIMAKYDVPGGAVFLNKQLSLLTQEILEGVLVPEEEGEIVSLTEKSIGTFFTADAVPITEKELDALRSLDFSVTVTPSGTAAGGAGARMNLTGGRSRRRRHRSNRKSRRHGRGKDRK